MGRWGFRTWEVLGAGPRCGTDWLGQYKIQDPWYATIHPRTLSASFYDFSIRCLDENHGSPVWRGSLLLIWGLVFLRLSLPESLRLELESSGTRHPLVIYVCSRAYLLDCFSQLQSDSSFSAKPYVTWETKLKSVKTAKRFFPLQKQKEEIMLLSGPVCICHSQLLVYPFPPWLAEASFPSTTTFEWIRQTTDWPLEAWHCFVSPLEFGWNLKMENISNRLEVY